jgi:hypothetical protein
MHDENYFCIAYKQNAEKHADGTGIIKAVIFHTPNEKLHETIIKEYIRNLSRLNDARFNSSRRSTINSEIMKIETTKLQKRSCGQCPMQQYTELCERLNLMQSEYKIYLFLLKIFDKSLAKADQDLVSDLLKEQNINVNVYNTYFDRNRLLVGLLHKLCSLKQLEHLHSDLVVQTEFRLLQHSVDSNGELKKDDDQSVAGLKNKREKFSLDNIHSTNLLVKNNRRRVRNQAHREKSKDEDIVNLSDDDDNSSYLVGFKDNNKLSLELNTSLSTFKNSVACLTPPVRQQQKKPHFLTTSLNQAQPVYKRRESMRRSIFNKVQNIFKINS